MKQPRTVIVLDKGPNYGRVAILQGTTGCGKLVQFEGEAWYRTAFAVEPVEDAVLLRKGP